MTLKAEFIKHIIPLLAITFITVNCSQTSELTTSSEQEEQDFFSESENDLPEYVDVVVAEEFVNSDGDTSYMALRNAFVELRNYRDYSRIQSFNSDMRGQLEIPVSSLSNGDEYVIVVSEQQTGASGTFLMIWDDYYRPLFLENRIEVILGQNIRSDQNTARNQELQAVGDPRRLRIN